ncbi:MAG TPA: hypothetical protein VGF34_16170 [Stellaceae bacterium]|jgi:hypothetical protein
MPSKGLFSVLFAALLLLGRPIGVPPAAAAENHDFEFCEGYFALCAASTCTPTGGNIRVNVATGGTAVFPEARCLCPIFQGRSIADLAGGNMHGSCDTPKPDQIWSLYAAEKLIPQQINNWVASGSEAVAPYQICPKTLGRGKQFANCFSFLCDSKRYINGVPVATCHCPMGESLSGTPVAAFTTLVTQGGQRDKAFCAAHPVAGPISLP